VLQFQYLAGQSLTQGENGTSAELGKVHRLRHLLVHLIIGFYLAGIGQTDLLVIVFHLAIGHHHAVAVDLKVALVGVDNNIKVLVTAIYFCEHVAETLLQHAYKRSAVDVLRILEFAERVNHAHLLFIFLLCCHSLFETD